MAWQAIKHGGTHEARENTTFVPALEGFAEWSTYKILKEISNGTVLNYQNPLYKYPDFPFNRAYIASALLPSEHSVANVDFTERGWHSMLNILTYPLLDRVDFNKPLSAVDTKYAFVSLFSTTSCPDRRLGYTLKDIMDIFDKYPSKGIVNFMSMNDLNFRHFLDRAGAVLPDFEQDDFKRVKVYLNPDATANPCT